MTAISTEHGLQERIDHARAAVASSADRMMGGLLGAQWLALVGVAFFVTPRTWVGSESSVHVHVIAALLLGGLAVLPAIALCRFRRGTLTSRLVASGAQGVLCALYIHFSGGRVEAHFAIFATLAFMIAYQDWRAVLPAAGVAAVDHVLRGALWPQSLLGVESTSLMIIATHALWVVIETGALVWFAVRMDRATVQAAAAHHHAEQQREAISVDAISIGSQLAEIQSSRDLTRRVSVGDESLQTAAEGVNGFILALGEVIDSTNTTADSSASAAQQLAAAATELSSTVESAQRTTSETESASQQASVRTSSSAQTLRKTIDRLNEIGDAVESGVSSVEELEHLCGPIEESLTIISDISDQTNLLALNAAIEAARAGEHGRGFAVVADEVRKLAERTLSATEDVGRAVRAITEKTRSAAEQMRTINESAKESVESSTGAAAELDGIVEATREFGERMAVLTASMDEMRTASESVSYGAETLDQQVTQLREMSSRYRASA